MTTTREPAPILRPTVRPTIGHTERLEQLGERLTMEHVPDHEVELLLRWTGAGVNRADARGFCGWLRAVATDELRRRRHGTKPLRLSALLWFGWAADDVRRARAAMLGLLRSLPDDASGELARLLLGIGEMIATLGERDET